LGTTAETSGLRELVGPGLVDQAEFYRLDAARFLNQEQRAELGQFMTPAAVSRLMGSFAGPAVEDIRLLDPGAGVGSLSAAWIEEMLRREILPRSIHLTAFEIDHTLVKYLRQTVSACRKACEQAGVLFDAKVVEGDFIAQAAAALAPGCLFGDRPPRFDAAILNPPYRKISSHSDARFHLRSVGIETSNLYTAFLWLVLLLLDDGAEFVAITPRSFCNGPYFRPFRQALLREARITNIHVFDSRSMAFQDDDVLQENIIFRALKTKEAGEAAIVSVSHGPEDSNVMHREVDPDELVSKDDPDQIIHIVPDELESRIARRIRSFSSSLDDLLIGVSTGRVVDFRAKQFLVTNGNSSDVGEESAPLLYPMHFENGTIFWPRDGRKPNSIRVTAETRSLLVPPGVYVLVKRFSAKEEKRRVCAALCQPSCLGATSAAFENHLNYYHENGRGLPLALAKGLTAYLNSTLLDAYFRQFSGHTQVNASDLRGLPYPDRYSLTRIGESIGDTFPPQNEIDRLISRELPNMTDNDLDPLQAKQKLDEALEVLVALGLPGGQQNERSALTLLALIGVTPTNGWKGAANPLMGITPIMEFAEKFFGRKYAPNTRETFRRQTMHQFVAAGIALYNPDKRDRPVNSPNAVYQIEPGLLKVLRSFGSKEWDSKLSAWLASVGTLKARWARRRRMAKIPLELPNGQRITLSPGGQNVLVAEIIHEFCPRFVPGGLPVYVGDTESKHAFFDSQLLDQLGIRLDAHGKMPDIVVYHAVKNWLVLIEAVTSHGPVDSKRRDELKALFSGSKAPLVFVTAFLDRKVMMKYLNEISWETEVWVADAPSHMIHFNGERFLGPYDD